ncbi:YciI family protein [Sphingobacterium sp. UDSM-2020]|uniref:YciI family protein n=1 Tax=Sphingobacterium TaxID=28453 RepID=UPI0019374237|nr:YciI family protein [Sphingobacterium sp. UDSM-2020]QQD11783.1 hypothetical protein JAZ75_14210 [Sphingobacterium sp. UDSM-2020]
MKNILYLGLLILGTLSRSYAQKTNAKYDHVLADSLGADNYGMKYYSFVLLKTGATKITDKDSVNRLFDGHMKNIQRLAKEKKLIVAGPFGKNERDYRGIFILNVKTIKEAESLLSTDPAIKAGLLISEITLWYGSAALPLYLEASEKVNKFEF